MKFTQVALPLIFSGAAIAAPAASQTLRERSTETCDQYGSITSGAYVIYQDLWDEAAATSGSQCSTLDSLSGSTIAWSTSWSWEGASSSVKSYANAALASVMTTGVQISSISSIDAVWTWSYTGSDIVADVSWDLFTASSSEGTNEYEIMIWLSALGGAGPISSTGSAVSTTTIAGLSFDLYSGTNGDTTVYSFVASGAPTSGDFSGDLMDFFTYLVDNEGYSTSQYINVLEAGTEPFTGSDAVFTVSAYSVAISQGSSDSASAVASSSVASSTVAVASSTVVAVASSTSVTAPSSTSIVIPSSAAVAIPTSPAYAVPSSTLVAVAPATTSTTPDEDTCDA